MSLSNQIANITRAFRDRVVCPIHYAAASAGLRSDEVDDIGDLGIMGGFNLGRPSNFFQIFR